MSNVSWSDRYSPPTCDLLTGTAYHEQYVTEEKDYIYFTMLSYLMRSLAAIRLFGTAQPKVVPLFVNFYVSFDFYLLAGGGLFILFYNY